MIRSDKCQEPSLDPGFADKDYYAILDVDKSSTDQEIREAFLGLKSVYDEGNQALYSLVSHEDAAKMLAEVEEAYRVLGEVQSRKRYDRFVGGQNARLADVSIGAVTGHSRDGAGPDRLRIDDLTTSDMSGLGGARRRICAEKVHGADFLAEIESIVREAEDFEGSLFRRIREHAQVSLEEMQEHIKVSIDSIMNIEADQFDRLPQPVYVKGFLRSYLKYLGIADATLLVNGYMERLRDWSNETAS